LASTVTVVRLPFIARYKDRHGKLRHYYRRPGHKQVPLPGIPGSPAFMDAYRAAAKAAESPAPRAAGKIAPGSLDALAISYYGSPAWRTLRASTQANYRRIIERLRGTHGTAPVVMLDARGVRMIMAQRQEQPAAANHLLRVIRQLMGHAIQLGWLDADPTAGVRRYRTATKGFTPWSEADIAAYEARHPTGTRERLALALLLYTGQRRSDVVRLGWQHVREAEGRLKIEVRQIKTGTRCLIPVHAALLAELQQLPRDRLAFMVTDAGPPFTANGFYMRFSEWRERAGLPAGLSPHGLRKATGRRLMEAGCTPAEIGSVLGHKTLAEMQKYVADFDRDAAAERAMGRIENTDRLTRSRLDSQKKKIGG